MNIKVISSIGSGSTLLSAFDHALYEAGVHNYNLIPLSSIIPPGAKVIKNDRYKRPKGEFGHRLYVVMAQMRSDKAGKWLASAVGWYQLEDKRGFFVEHHIIADSEESVRSDIDNRILNSLNDMCKFRGIEFEKKSVKSSVAITQVKSKPTCALTIAVYKSEGWE